MKNVSYLGILTALSSSICCIMPILAIITGTSGIASTFSWLEPARPYFIGMTVLILGFAWYQKIKPQKKNQCNCKIEQKTKLMQSKMFLGLVTIFSILMLTFPFYAHIFYPNTEKQPLITNKINMQVVDFMVDGMTCKSCEEHINYKVNKLFGIIKSSASFENGNVVVEFDNSKITSAEIEKVINSTGYSVTAKKEK